MVVLAQLPRNAAVQAGQCRYSGEHRLLPELTLPPIPFPALEQLVLERLAFRHVSMICNFIPFGPAHG